MTLNQFCDENNWLSSELLLPANTFTYLSERWDSTSWLDHCVSTSDGHDVIQNINVLYSLCTSDHIPMCIDVSLELVPQVEGPQPMNVNKSAGANLVTTVLMVMLRLQKK